MNGQSYQEGLSDSRILDHLCRGEEEGFQEHPRKLGAYCGCLILKLCGTCLQLILLRSIMDTQHADYTQSQESTA